MPQRPLADPRKHRIAQLLKAHIHRPRDTIGDGQTNRAKRQKRHAFVCQTVNGPFVKNRDEDRNQLGHHKKDHRPNDAPFHPRHILGPQVRCDLFDNQHVRLTLGCVGDFFFGHRGMGGFIGTGLGAGGIG